MSIIKKEILFKKQTAYIDFNLDSKDSFLGYQQNIDNISKFESSNVVNDAVDGEKRKFKFYSEDGSQTLKFFFLNSSKVYQNSLSALGLGWDIDNVTGGSTHVLNSFFILDFYDSPVVSKQRKLFSTYLTKFIKNINPLDPTYSIPLIMDDTNKTQLFYLYIPRSYINKQTQPTITGYTKLSFFNSVDGTIKSFTNTEQYGVNEESLFLRTELNLTGRTWQFFLPVSKQVTLYQLDGGEYDTRMSDTVQKESIKEPRYPTFKIFDYTRVDYRE